jgi:O-antigen ligase
MGQGILICAALAAVYLLYPQHALLIITPGLIPATNIDLGLGITVMPIIVVAALFGGVYHRIRGTHCNNLGHVPSVIIVGWIILIIALAVSTTFNSRSLGVSFLTWLVRCALMLEYIQAFRNYRSLDYALMGWVMVGVISTLGSMYALATTGTILALHAGLLSESGQGDILAVVTAIVGPASYMVISIWALWALRARKILSLAFAASCSILFILPLFMSGRRQGVLALLISIAIFILLSRKLILQLLVGIALIGIGFLVYSPLITEFVTGRPSMSDEFANEGTGRLEIYDAGLKGFLEKPVLGWGLNAYSTISAQYGAFQSDSYEGAASHNTFIGVAAEAGLLGLTGLLLITFGVTRVFYWLLQVALAFPRSPAVYIVPIFGYTLAGALVSSLVEGHGYLLSMALLCGVYVLWFRQESFNKG